MVTVTNAFSINMLNAECTVSFKKLTVEEAQGLLADGFESAVGHADTAAVFADVLGATVPTNRVTLEFTSGVTRLVVGQYKGPRLEEGTKFLPAGATIEWWLVE